MLQHLWGLSRSVSKTTITDIIQSQLLTGAGSISLVLHASQGWQVLSPGVTALRSTTVVSNTRGDRFQPFTAMTNGNGKRIYYPYWLPVHWTKLLYLKSTVVNNSCTKETFNFPGVWLSSFNSTANPFVYALPMPSYQKCVRQTFCACVTGREMMGLHESESMHTISSQVSVFLNKNSLVGEIDLQYLISSFNFFRSLVVII